MKVKLKDFDPNDLATNTDNIYGLPFTVEDASLVILPVPWEVTVSYSSGTADGPEAVFNASFQVDLYDPFVKNAWRLGVAMESVDKKLKSKSASLRKKAKKYIDTLASGKKPDEKIRKEINAASKDLNAWVKKRSLKFMDQKKTVGLLGGDHSTPFGLILALAEKNKEFAVLQIDAHADLRVAFEGFDYSHASIMYNILQVPQVKKLVQVGIRDYCQAELDIINSNKKVKTFFDRDIKHQQFQGRSWSDICDEIVSTLPDKVYLSIDIDGLDPKLCPNTGTPVPGGFEFEQLLFLFEKLVKSKRKIIGFDLNEVSPGDNEWDANIGARLLYRVANLTLSSQNQK